jgi:hypothetical protein
MTRPPRLALRLLSCRFAADDLEAIAGDLEEEFHDVADRHGPAAARRWVWRETLRLLAARVPRADRVERPHAFGRDRCRGEEPRCGTTSDMGFDGTTNLAIQAGDAPHRIAAEIVTPSYFTLVRVAASRGRVFGPEDNRDAGRASVVVLGDALWRTAFGGDAAIVGKTITLKQRPYEVIGIAPGIPRPVGPRAALAPMMAAEHLMRRTRPRSRSRGGRK